MSTCDWIMCCCARMPRSQGSVSEQVPAPPVIVVVGGEDAWGGIRRAKGAWRP